MLKIPRKRKAAKKPRTSIRGVAAFCGIFIIVQQTGSIISFSTSVTGLNSPQRAQKSLEISDIFAGGSRAFIYVLNR